MIKMSDRRFKLELCTVFTAFRNHTDNTTYIFRSSAFMIVFFPKEIVSREIKL
jgi:hypothetical protein